MSSTQFVPPIAVTGLKKVVITPTTLTLSWVAPAEGTRPFVYEIDYRITGSDDAWKVGTRTSATTGMLTGLQPSTHYDIIVVAFN